MGCMGADMRSLVQLDLSRNFYTGPLRNWMGDLPDIQVPLMPPSLLPSSTTNVDIAPIYIHFVSDSDTSHTGRYMRSLWAPTAVSDREIHVCCCVAAPLGTAPLQSL